MSAIFASFRALAPAARAEQNLVRLAATLRQKNAPLDTGKPVAKPPKDPSLTEAMDILGLSEKQKDALAKSLAALDGLARQTAAAKSPSAKLDQIQKRAAELKEKLEALKRAIAMGGKPNRQMLAELKQLVRELRALGTSIKDLGDSASGEDAPAVTATANTASNADVDGEGTAEAAAGGDAAQAVSAAPSDEETPQDAKADEGAKSTASTAPGEKAKADAEYLKRKSETRAEVERLTQEASDIEKRLQRKLEEEQRHEGRQGLDKRA